MLVATLAVATALAGCGGGKSARDRVKSIVTTYLTALADGDGATACAVLTDGQQQAVVGAAAAAGVSSGSCARVLGGIAATLDAGAKSKLREARVTSVSVHGSRAIVRVAGGSAAAELEKRSGRWLIAGGVTPSSVSGGLGDLFATGRGSNAGDQLVRKRIGAAEQRLRTDPKDRAALAEVIRGHYQLATTMTDPATGSFPAAARRDLLAATRAWQKYQAIGPPDPGPARVVIQAYQGLATLASDPGEARPYWAGAAGAGAEVAAAQPSSVNYVVLVRYASLAGQTRTADLAGQKAIELAPKRKRAAVKAQVAQAKAVAAAAP